MAPKKNESGPAAPSITPGTDQQERHRGPKGPSRTPPRREQRERDHEQEADDKMDAVIRDTPL
jgi:hypothetical protein